MELNGAFGLTEIGPGEQAQSKVDGSGVKAEQLIVVVLSLYYFGESLFYNVSSKPILDGCEIMMVKRLPGGQSRAHRKPEYALTVRIVVA